MCILLFAIIIIIIDFSVFLVRVLASRIKEVLEMVFRNRRRRTQRGTGLPQVHLKKTIVNRSSSSSYMMFSSA